MPDPTIARFLSRCPELREATEKVLAFAAAVRDARARALPADAMPAATRGPEFRHAERELFAAAEGLESLATDTSPPSDEVTGGVRRVMRAAMAMRVESHGFSPRRRTTSPEARAGLFMALSAFDRAFRELEEQARASHAPRIPWQIELATHVTPGTPVTEMELTGYELPGTPATRRAWGERCFLSGTAWNTDSHAAPALRYRSLDSCNHTLAPKYHALWCRLRAALDVLRQHAPEAVARIVRLLPSLREDYVEERSAPAFTALGLLDFPSLAVSLNNFLRTYGHRPLFGRRGRDKPTDYSWATYDRIRTLSLRLAFGLEELGMRPGERLGILSPGGCREFHLADFASIFARLVSVGLPASLSDEQLRDVVERMGLHAVVTGAASLHRFVEQPGCELIVAFGPGAAHARAPADGPRVVDLEDLLTAEVPATWSSASGVSPETPVLYGDAKGHQQAEALGIHPDQDDDLYTILLTSGSTGRPKGTVVTRRRWAEEMCFESSVWPHVSISFQPPALAADRGSVWRTLTGGGRVGFARPGADLFADARALRPTILDAPPVVWNTLYREYKQAIRDPDLSRAESAAVKRRFRNYLGGRLAFIATGGAPSDPGVRQTMETIFGLPMKDGYGTTETGTIAANGVLLPGLDVRLIDLPELGFSTADRPHPRGELAVRTHRTTARYWRDATGTRKGYTSDGYFLTGDIVEIGPGRCCTILGRRKQLFKLANSELVSPEALERHYLKSERVEAVLIAGSPRHHTVVAVVVPASDAVTEGELVAEFRAIAQRAGLRPSEVPAAVVIEPRAGGDMPWRVDNGLLTPSLKLHRHALEAKYLDRIEAAGARSQATRSVTAPGAGNGSDDLETLTRRLARVVAAILSLPPGSVDVERSFVEHGGDSVTLMELKLRLDQVFAGKATPRGLGIDDPGLLVESPLATVARRIHQRRGRPAAPHRDPGRPPPHVPEAATDSPAGTPPARSQHAAPNAEATAEAANADANTDGWPDELPPPATLGHVLLTGATGFLGVHLLDHLAATLPSDRRLYALVRAGDDDAARGRLRDALAGASLEVPEIGLPGERAKVVALAGSLAAERLGLDEGTYDRLAAEVGLIYHVAAEVSAEKSYAELRAANVLGTRRILELATTATLKSLHFVSSLNVALLLRQISGRRVTEDTPLPERLSPRVVASNPDYGVSKWLCERMIQRLFARSRGAFRVSISRPALITWSQATGHANRGDWLSRVLSSCLSLRRAIGTGEVGALRWVPETPVSARGLDMVPVDFVARALGRLGELTHASALAGSDVPPSQVPTFHVSNTAPGESGLITLPHLMDMLVAADLSYGESPRSMAFVPFAEWLQQAEIEGAAVQPILHQVKQMSPMLERTEASRFTAAMAGPEEFGEACPAVDQALVETYVRTELEHLTPGNE